MAGNRLKLKLFSGGSSIPLPVPVNITPPAASGPVGESETLTTSNGDWSNSPTSYVYQWQVSDTGVGGWSDISGATGQSLIQTSAMVTKYLRPGVRASNATGPSASYAYGFAVGPVTPLPSELFAPLVADRTLRRTMLVPVGDEVVNLSTEVVLPGSPGATSFSIGGASAANWEQLTPGMLTAVPATRSSLKGTTQNLTVQATNSNGSSSVVNLTIISMADADCRFASYENGSDANNGTTPALAWKHCPRSYPFTGTQVTLGADKAIFFEGGTHRYALATSATGATAVLPHGGTSGSAQFHYVGTGWGTERATFTGDELIAGTPASVTQAEVGGNPNYLNIKKLTLSSAAQSYQQFFSGDLMMFAGQYPMPADPLLNEGVQDVSESQGMFTNIAVTTSTGTTPRMSRSGTVLTIVDPRISAKYGNVASATVEGSQVIYWSTGNFTSFGTVTSYTFATSTLVVNAPTALQAGAIGAYGLVNHPALIGGESQYATSADGLTVYYWEPNPDQKSIARLTRGMPLGTNNVTVSGFRFQRYAGGSFATGAAFTRSTGAVNTNIDLNDIVARQIRQNDGEGGVIANTGGGNVGFSDCNMERFHVSECPRSGGFRNGAQFIGLSGTPTAAQVRAYAKGKIRYWFFEANAMGGTTFLFTWTTGMQFANNIHLDSSTTHGQFMALYSDPQTAPAPNQYCNYSVIEYNLGYNVERCNAYSGDTVARNNTWTGNVFLGAADGLYVSQLDPGSTFTRNIMGYTPAGYYAYAWYIYLGAGVVASNNVIGGMARASPLASCTYNITNNLMTVNQVVENDGPTRVFTGNTIAADAPNPMWDAFNDPIPAEWQTALGSGRIGPFWNIP